MKNQMTRAAKTRCSLSQTPFILGALFGIILFCCGCARSQDTATVPNLSPVAVSGGNEAQHLVFAHYMLCYDSSVTFYKREIELAQRHGIDGFALNAGEWLRPNGTKSNYVNSADKMYQAAQELGSGFKLFFSPDLNSLGNLTVNVGDMVAHFKDHPNQLRHDGKVVLSGWAGTPTSYAEAVNKIKAGGTPVFFVPFVFNSRYSFNWSDQAVRRFYDGQPHMDGVFFFGADGIYPEIMRTNSTGTRVSHEMGKLFMAGVSPAYNSPNLRDFHGMQGYSEMWKSAIQDGADWIEIVTWNDYNEDSNIMPFRWPAGSEKNHISRDESFLDLTSYYSAWYKSGVQPTIAQDKIYYSYRNRSKALTRAWNPVKKEWFDITRGQGRVDQIHDDVEDNVYITAFLTAPAELTVGQGKSAVKFPLGTGINHVAVPMQPGVPHFTLTRASKAVLDFWGRKLIIDQETEENSPTGYHLSNRTWGGGAVSGQATRFEAESGTLSGGATVVKDGPTTAIQNLEQDGSGVSVAVQGLRTGTYNIRLSYSNPSPTEARLTLMADGAPQGDVDVIPYIPAFLPPTGAGKYATTSLLWSLYDKTSFLKLAWVQGHAGGLPQGQLQPGDDDKGQIRLDAIELVPVAPVTVPAPRDAALPTLIAIPGGNFMMGSREGAPDEAPVHSITLSAFALGQTEITNAQYEKFDPAHHNLRDEYSWRDADPVIYVSWRDAANYCNWLSKQQGLTPIYDEKTGQVDPKANGYRLPSEAEWEYVASGRGQGQKYPWGNETPDAMRGNFLLQPPGSPTLPPEFIGSGTTPVGSFPAGASRDGVLDLAGNVSEWCGDYYQPYDATPQTDPVAQTTSNYRVLRGDSWGYYGRSPRATDREFNSPGYGGYIYLGFRIARTGAASG